MNVIIVNDYGHVNGGAGKVALESAMALTNHVETVHVFTAIGEAADMLKHTSNLKITALHQKKVTELPFAKSVGGGLWNKEVEEEFSKVLDLYSPKDTVIHVHSWRDGTTLSFMPEVQKRGFKYVFTAHDYGLACPIAGFFDHRTNTVCNFKALSGACLRSNCTNTSIVKKSWFSLRHYMQVKRARIPSNLKHLITVSETTEKILVPYLNERTRVHFVPNPLPIERKSRVEAERNRPYAFVGRFSAEKAPLLAAEATQKAGVPIMFIGTGTLASEVHSLHPEAELMGWRKPDEVHELLRQARALIFPSVWYEAQGMVVDEAAALGLPVIVSDITAAVESIFRHKHGSTFTSGDVDALVRRIQEFEHDDVVKSFSEAGYNSYWQNPASMDNHIVHLMRVYETVLSDAS